MSDSARSLDVLKKILRSGGEKKEQLRPEALIEKHLSPEAKIKGKTKLKSRGRPKLEEHLKARNFTLCLAPKYLAFLDNMQVKEKKIQGRGRKIRFIIDQFVELHRRQKSQLQVLKEVLTNIEKVLNTFSGKVKKGEKLDLTTREKAEITKAVGQFQILLKVLGFTPKDLHRLLPRNEWAIVSFCMDWMKKSGVKYE